MDNVLQARPLHTFCSSLMSELACRWRCWLLGMTVRCHVAALLAAEALPGQS